MELLAQFYERKTETPKQTQLMPHADHLKTKESKAIELLDTKVPAIEAVRAFGTNGLALCGNMSGSGSFRLLLFSTHIYWQHLRVFYQP